MSLAEGSGRHAALAVLQILRADAGYNPFAVSNWSIDLVTPEFAFHGRAQLPSLLGFSSMPLHPPSLAPSVTRS